MQNLIEREITIKADKQRIYEAMTNPDQLILWFPETIEGECKVGGRPIFGFGDYGKNQIYIVAANPYDYFSYRWVPGSTNFIGDVLTVPNTLVEFRIEEGSDGMCKVIVTETGFAELPADIAESSFQENSGGWDFMLGRFEKYLSGD